MECLNREELSRLSPQGIPVAGGDGMSVESAYILSGIDQFEAPSVEHLIIDLTLKASGYLFWMLNKQISSIENDRKIDCLKVTAMQSGGSDVFTFYFDLSEI